jgi:hypothetical protein
LTRCVQLGEWETGLEPSQGKGWRGKRVTISNVSVRPNGGQLAELAKLLAANQLSLRVATTYRIEEAAPSYSQRRKGPKRCGIACHK